MKIKRLSALLRRRFPALGKLLLAVSAFATAVPQSQAIPPQEALAKMKVADGFQVKLFASEPEIRQPVSMYFDERGRMWVIQYLQYPTPAGLKAVKVDTYLRTTYDKVPPPPPLGPKGADRITICEDTDGDGKADSFKDFVGGLNLATGMAIGHGGVYVLQAPYLLFYPDRNHDDLPDSYPEVLLTGFGMEDAHALANSLQWGPDGWLYGAQGSTVTAHINGIEFQQGIWRFHPATHAFEVFAEGGGNTWGLDFDKDGNIIAGTNFNEVGLHQVQGAYYVKNFGKHGELHNPYAFGYFDHIPYKGFKGGHVTAGGIVYQGGSFPSSFENCYIAGNLLANSVYWHAIEPSGSSFKGHFAGDFLLANDPWFRPVDCLTGPDGAVFVADWYDKRATHLDPKDTWDRSNGRIYKIQADGAKPVAKFDLRTAPSSQLVGYLAHPNEWFARESRRILAERKDQTILPELLRILRANKSDRLSLEALWAYNVTKPLDEELARELLAHAHPYVRSWVVRLLGDAQHLPSSLENEMTRLARTEPSPVVRSQLACSSKRFSGANSLPPLFELLKRTEDQADIFIPNLLWWALESKADSDQRAILEFFQTASNWDLPLVRFSILERLARRYAATGQDRDLAVCGRLLDLAPSPAAADLVLGGIDKALQNGAAKSVPAELDKALQSRWGQGPPSPVLLRVALRLGRREAVGKAVENIQDSKTPENDRLALVEALGQKREPSAVQPIESILGQSASARLLTAAIGALQNFNEPTVATALLRAHAKASPEIRKRLRTALLTRPDWTAQTIEAVRGGKIDAKDFTPDQLRQVWLHKNPEIIAKAEKLWGRVTTESLEQKQSYINEIKLLLQPSGTTGRDAKGNSAHGREVFVKNCGVCHTLFDEGGNIGPNLTGADRKNLDFMLPNIVSPSAFIRPEFLSYDISTKDDQSFSGLMVDSTPTSVTLLDRNNQKHLLQRAQIREITASTVSLMPEGLLESMSQEEISDLFAWLQSEPKAK